MNENDLPHQSWKDKISNHNQIGGIETALMDNGPGRGTRFAWINTGTGLRFKVVLDRSMDIADAFYNQHSLAWLSHSGITSPEPFSNRGADWLKTFGGGLITTCGLSHIGGSESDAYGERGLHGQISNIPAGIESIIQPDPIAGKMEMSITGTMKQTQVLGPSLELRRTISAKLGDASIRIHDEVTNRGNTPAPHMMLYHANFGWPLVDEGSDIVWHGRWQSRDGDTNNRIFNKNNNFRRSSAPLDEHCGIGEEAAFIDVTAGPSGECICGIHNHRIGIAVALRFNKKQLPWLTNWQHWGRGEYVTGLEPGTNPPIGQAAARGKNELIQLAPGESRAYDLGVEVLTNEADIREFLKNLFEEE